MASRGATRRRERVSTGRDEYLLRRGRVVTTLSLPGRLNPRATPSGVTRSRNRLRARSGFRVRDLPQFRSYSVCLPRIPVNIRHWFSLKLLRQLYYGSVYVVITAS